MPLWWQTNQQTSSPGAPNRRERSKSSSGCGWTPPRCAGSSAPRSGRSGITTAADSPDEDALTALTHSDAEHLRPPAPSAAERQEQVDMELDAAQQHLRTVHERY
jgi:hypothetical protein